LKVLLDTTVLVDHLRGHEAASTFLTSLEARLLSSEIVRVETITGLRSHERSLAERLFALIGWIALDEPIARRAGELGRRYRASHQGIGAADLAIAATAEHLGATLATANVKHFPMFPGLAPAY
jgi:predicted nucleic acid-binding protein